MLNTIKDEGHIPNVETAKSLHELKEQEIEASAIINDEVKNEPVEDQSPQTPPLYNQTSKGIGNPFAGTSWGN